MEMNLVYASNEFLMIILIVFTCDEYQNHIHNSYHKSSTITNVLLYVSLISKFVQKYNMK